MKTILNGIKTLVSGEIGKVRRSIDGLSRSVDELDARVAEKAPKKMVATILKNAEGNWCADKTFSELVQHIKDGGTVEASYGGETLRCYWRSEDYLSFIRTRTYENDIDTVNLNIWSDDLVDVYVGHIQAVPSPSEVSKESIGKLLKISDVGIIDGNYQVTKTEAVDIDTTLTVEGAIADAKAVGDKLAEKIPAPATASVGQTIVVKEVDENGKPIAWEASDFPNWRLIKRITLEEDTFEIPGFTVDDDGNTFDLKAVRVISPNIASSIYVSNDMHGRLWVGLREGYSPTNTGVFANNAYIEIGMMQNPPSNYPFWGQVEYAPGAWHILTSDNRGIKNDKFEFPKSKTIQKLGLTTNNSNTFIYAAGVIIEFWGVDA